MRTRWLDAHDSSAKIATPSDAGGLREIKRRMQSIRKLYAGNVNAIPMGPGPPLARPMAHATNIQEAGAQCQNCGGMFNWKLPRLCHHIPNIPYSMSYLGVPGRDCHRPHHVVLPFFVACAFYHFRVPEHMAPWVQRPLVGPAAQETTDQAPWTARTICMIYEVPSLHQHSDSRFSSKKTRPWP